MYEEELAFADELAEEAARIALSLFGTDLDVRTKPDRTPVTEADVGVERMIRSRLAERFPDDAVLGEEGGRTGDAPRVWVIDPIDGTKNFAAGIQIWATLIALVVEGEPVLGLANAAALGERYAAASGAGATLNGREIRVSETSSLDEAFVLTAGESSFLGGADREWFVELSTTARRTRGFGDFWAHLLVARGAADVALEPELHVWDYAALVPIVEEAGGRVSTLDGTALREGGSMLTTNDRLHPEVLSVIGKDARRGTD
ncbi:MAG: inositol monophosphatase family protein [Actinomycetota bacterium]